MRTLEDIIKEFGEIPVCGCSKCQKIGRKVNVYPEYYSYYKKHGLPKYIKGHHMVDNETGKEKIRIKKKEYLETHPDFNKGENHPNYGKRYNILPLLTIDDFIRNIGEIPICSCDECTKIGRRIEIKLNRDTYNKYKRVGYPKFTQGHYAKANPPMYNPDVHKTIEEIIQELGEPPVCDCDECKKVGRRVEIYPEYYTKYKEEGYPQYLPYHHKHGMIGRYHTIESHLKMSKTRWIYSGCDASTWNGFIVSLYKCIRECIKYDKWRKDILCRDKYTCQWCGKTKCSLEAHHIKRFSKILKENNITTLEEAYECEELWNLNNGITLCEECHKKTRIKNKNI